MMKVSFRSELKDSAFFCATFVDANGEYTMQRNVPIDVSNGPYRKMIPEIVVYRGIYYTLDHDKPFYRQASSSPYLLADS